MTAASSGSLYQRLGGYDAVASVVGDFYERAFAGSETAVFFRGHSRQSRQRIVQHTVDLFCALAGGPAIYTGADMVSAHDGLELTERDWRATGAHLVGALDGHGVAEVERNELLELITRYKDEIVAPTKDGAG